MRHEANQDDDTGGGPMFGLMACVDHFKPAPPPTTRLCWRCFDGPGATKKENYLINITTVFNGNTYGLSELGHAPEGNGRVDEVCYKGNVNSKGNDILEGKFPIKHGEILKVEEVGGSNYNFTAFKRL